MAYGLVLGGGGVVGIAWELGVLDALMQEQALSPTEAAALVGVREVAVGVPGVCHACPLGGSCRVS